MAVDSYEKGLIESAAKAKSQWKLPRIWTILSAIFLGDHYTSMWQTAMLAITWISYGIVRYFEIRLDPEYALAATLWAPTVLIYWIVATFFLVLDSITKKEGKHFQQRTAVALFQTLAVVLRNHVLIDHAICTNNRLAHLHIL